ncbi:helix-turn-helix transcriptional regulator [Bythopirellula polymerisocia]|uniref:Sugar-specific transcriptional regulator TrmB n=1 Tax=Bythopirellula polymerisocia TaxID=2528003 RepID=A0A5C6D2W4_9BACT|nr:winged helix-turn-helix transcriptional regulator [Bythopirellula polymerisocia]TWU29997.1 hypothetical protein Pla144_07780 [Bythopirellula polymerisocia]
MAKTKAKKPDRHLTSKTPSNTPQAHHEGETSHGWTFLTNHSHVLILLDTNSELVLREVAARVGITERAVQRIVHDLEEGGFIEIERVGRKNRYVVHKDQPLRHSIEAHRKIGDLLKLVSGK